MNLKKTISKIKVKCLATLIIFNLSIIIIIYVYLQYDVATPLPLLIWWTPFTGGYERTISCETHKCVVTSDRTRIYQMQLAALLFYGSDIQIEDFPLPRNYSIPWAIYHEESPKNLPFINSLQGQKLFNITSTFSRFSDLPLVLQYLENVNFLIDKKYFKTIQFKNALLKNISPVLYIQRDCDTPINRDSYVKELMKYINIDSYGECLNNKKLDEKFVVKKTYDLYNEEFMHFVSKYKFVISIENSACYDYITEKLWRPLIVGSVPVYLGSPTIEDWLPNEKAAILIKKFKSPKDVADFIRILNENDTMYNEYLEHKLIGKIANLKLSRYFKTAYGRNGNFESTVETFECYVCDNHKKINFPIKNVYNCLEPTPNNNWYYHWKIGKCQAKVLNHLINNLRVTNITKYTFDELTLEYLQTNICN